MISPFYDGTEVWRVFPKVRLIMKSGIWSRCQTSSFQGPGDFHQPCASAADDSHSEAFGVVSVLAKVTIPLPVSDACPSVFPLCIWRLQQVFIILSLLLDLQFAVHSFPPYFSLSLLDNFHGERKI